MRISDEPGIITHRGSAPMKEDGENIMGDGSSVQYKKTKFKSLPLRAGDPFQTNQSNEQIVNENCSSAYTLISKNQILSGIENFNSNGVRKRAFGSNTSNIQFPAKGRNHAHTVEEKTTKGSGMPGFGGILEDIYEVRQEFDVQVEFSDGRSNDEKNLTIQSACKGRTADNAGKKRGNPTGITLERNADSEEDQVSSDVQRDKTRLGVGSGWSLTAAGKGSTYSQFRMPARAVSCSEAPAASGMSRNDPSKVIRPQLFQTPYRSSTTPMNCGKANESRWKVEKIEAEYYCVMYCTWKPNTKRKGPWFDGILIRRGRSLALQDTEGKVVSKDGEQHSGALPEGATLLMGKFEVEVMRRSTEEEFLSGKVVLGTVDVPCDTIVEVIQKRAFKSFQAPTVKEACVSLDAEMIPPIKVPTAEVKPALERDGLVLNASDLQGSGVPIIVDPYLVSKLRPHQREGVKFMYECVMGLRNSCFTGCLLADAMGLGKTLQVIALIWTLIKQGPGGCPAVRRVLVICPSSLVENWGKEVRKWLGNDRLTPLIIHSGTTAKDVKRKLTSFQVAKVYPLLITSYELLRKHKDDLRAANPGLLVCDEAHRLKNCAGNKTIDSLLELKCSKRLILTGTPIQNDLLEFFAMIDFVNPSLLGPLSTFKRLYASPIEKSRDRNASDMEKILGRARSAELQSMTRFCILQRTADVNAKYLPTKTEFVVFCKLQPLQVSLYENFLRSKLVSETLATGQAAFVLSAIGTLRKLCNHPRLVEHELSKVNKNINGVSSGNKDDLHVLSEQPDGRQNRMSTDWRLSGKLSCLQRLLSTVHDSTSSDDYHLRETFHLVAPLEEQERPCLPLQILCEEQEWRWLRLDGTTDVSDRQGLVDRFNANYEESVFLLSSKAGGSGLNLIGANRLVLFDPDWNPATDAQAMARVWRDGQQKEVFIYRLLTTASIEEKIYQRQIMKGEVAAAVEEQVEVQYSGGDSGGRRHFSREELRELFTLDLDILKRLKRTYMPQSPWAYGLVYYGTEEDAHDWKIMYPSRMLQSAFQTFLETSCDTFDLLTRSEPSRSERWRDYSKEVEDHALKEAIQTGVVTFVYQNIYKKDIISSLDNVHAIGVDSRLEEERGELDSNQPDFSSFSSDILIDEIDELRPNCDQQIGNITADSEGQSSVCHERERLPTNDSKSNMPKREHNAEQNWDAKKHDLSSLVSDVFVDEMEVLLDSNEQISKPTYREHKIIIGPEGDGLATTSSSSTLSKRNGDREKIWDAKEHRVSVVGNDVFGDGIDDLLLECDARIANPIHREPKKITGLNDGRLPENSSSSNGSKRDNNLHENWDAKTHNVFSTVSEQFASPICKEQISMTGGEDGRSADQPNRTAFERESKGLENWGAKEHDVYVDGNDLPLDCDEKIANPNHNEHKRIKILENEHLLATNTSSALSESEINAEDRWDAKKHDADVHTSLADFSPATGMPNCLLETRSQKILKLLVDLPAPDDEFGEDEVEVLDAPFLCSLDVEMEMKRTSFAAEDLWQGVKLFVIGFLLGAKEQRRTYKGSKLGLVLDKCNVDRTTDDESMFCEGLPLVRAVLSRRDGHQAADVSYLFTHYEKGEHLLTTPSGRFLIDLMRLIDTMKTKKDGPH